HQRRRLVAKLPAELVLGHIDRLLRAQGLLHRLPDCDVLCLGQLLQRVDRSRQRAILGFVAPIALVHEHLEVVESVIGHAGRGTIKPCAPAPGKDWTSGPPLTTRAYGPAGLGAGVFATTAA